MHKAQTAADKEEAARREIPKNPASEEEESEDQKPKRKRKRAAAGPKPAPPAAREEADVKT
jgi:hypothetical protein